MLDEPLATCLCIKLAAGFNTSVLFGDHSRQSDKVQACILSHTNADTQPCNVSRFSYKRQICDQTETYKVSESISNEEAQLKSH